MRRHIFGFHHGLVTSFGSDVGMGVTGGVAIKVVTYIYNMGALYCKTPVVFVRVLGERVMGAFLKESEAANLRFPQRVVNTICQGCRHGCEAWCGEKKVYHFFLMAH